MAQKVFPFDWSYLERLSEISPGSLDELRLLLRFVATSQLPDPLETFFKMALAPHYDPGTAIGDAWLPRLVTLTGNVLYRLSDQVPEDRRQTLVIYVTDEGQEFTLQTWRALWLMQFDKGEESIPIFASGMEELFGLADGR